MQNVCVEGISSPCASLAPKLFEFYGLFSQSAKRGGISLRFRVLADGTMLANWLLVCVCGSEGILPAKLLQFISRLFRADDAARKSAYLIVLLQVKLATTNRTQLVVTVTHLNGLASISVTWC